MCDRERIAFTALEFAQLLVQNNVAISREAFVIIVRVLRNYKDIADDVAKPRMRCENQASAGGGQGLGNIPGEPAIIADAGDDSQFALEIKWYHEFLALNKRDTYANGLAKP